MSKSSKIRGHNRLLCIFASNLSIGDLWKICNGFKGEFKKEEKDYFITGAEYKENFRSREIMGKFSANAWAIISLSKGSE